MPVYLFVWKLLAWSITVVILLPLTIPWSVLAHRIWRGEKPLDEDMSDELWSRAWRVNLLLFFAAPLFVLLDHVTSSDSWLGLPPGPIHIVFFILFVAFVAWMMMYFFSMEDFFQGLMMATLHLYMPATVLFLLWLIIGWNPLYSYILGWLTTPTE